LGDVQYDIIVIQVGKGCFDYSAHICDSLAKSLLFM